MESLQEMNANYPAFKWNNYVAKVTCPFSEHTIRFADCLTDYERLSLKPV